MRMTVKPYEHSLDDSKPYCSGIPRFKHYFLFFYGVLACFTGFIWDLAKRRTDFKKGIQIAFLIIFTPPKFALDLINKKQTCFSISDHLSHLSSH